MDEERHILSGMLLLSHAIRRVFQDEALDPLKTKGVNPIRTGILHLIARRGEQTVNMLACFLGLSKGAASQNVDRLVRLGCATRHPDARDRRTVWIRITGKGRQLLEEAEQRQMDKLREFLAKIPAPLKLFLGERTNELSVALLETSAEEEYGCLQCCVFGAARCIRSPDKEGWICSFARNAMPAVAKDSAEGTRDVG